MLEQLTNLHNAVETTKASILKTQQILTSDLDSLIGRLDQAIGTVQASKGTPGQN